MGTRRARGREGGPAEASKPGGLPHATFQVVRQFQPSMNRDDVAAVLEDAKGGRWLAFNGEAWALLKINVAAIGFRARAVEGLREIGASLSELDQEAVDEAVRLLVEAIRDLADAVEQPFAYQDQCPDAVVGRGLQAEGGATP